MEITGNCSQCGEAVVVGPSELDASPGVSHHVDTLGGIDHDADADHTARVDDAWEAAEPQQRALAEHLGLPESDVLDLANSWGDCWTQGSREYLVLSDSEADERWDEYLDSYIDDCMGIPDAVMPYFDRDRWKADARSDGDRGQGLASYDGYEHDAVDPLTNTTYYIFRTN